MVIDGAILIPLRVWLKWVTLAGDVIDALLPVHDMIKRNAKYILNRKIGVMLHAHAFVQHLNPACRVARQFPQMGMSRLIMGLNDQDLDSCSGYANGSGGESFFHLVLDVPWALLLKLLSLLPRRFQLPLVDVLCAFLVNVALFGAYELIVFNWWIFLVLGIVSITCACALCHGIGHTSIVHSRMFRINYSPLTEEQQQIQQQQQQQQNQQSLDFLWAQNGRAGIEEEEDGVPQARRGGAVSARTRYFEIGPGTGNYSQV